MYMPLQMANFVKGLLLTLELKTKSTAQNEKCHFRQVCGPFRHFEDRVVMHKDRHGSGQYLWRKHGTPQGQEGRILDSLKWLGQKGVKKCNKMLHKTIRQGGAGDK